MSYDASCKFGSIITNHGEEKIVWFDCHAPSRNFWQGSRVSIAQPLPGKCGLSNALVVCHVAHVSARLADSFIFDELLWPLKRTAMRTAWFLSSCFKNENNIAHLGMVCILVLPPVLMLDCTVRTSVCQWVSSAALAWIKCERCYVSPDCDLWPVAYLLGIRLPEKPCCELIECRYIIEYLSLNRSGCVWYVLYFMSYFSFSLLLNCA